MFEIKASECQSNPRPGMEPVEGHANIFRGTESNLFYWTDETGDLSDGYVTLEQAEAVLDKYCEWLTGDTSQ
jgi:hypothetical protein